MYVDKITFNFITKIKCVYRNVINIGSKNTYLSNGRKVDNSAISTCFRITRFMRKTFRFGLIL